MDGAGRRRRLSFVARESTVWLFGSLVSPLSLVGGLVIAKHASFHSAVQQGQLFEIAIGIAATSVAVELVLRPGNLATSLYQLMLLLVLMGDLLYFASTAQVAGTSVTTNLSDGDTHASVVLLGVSVVLGIGAVARQSWQNTSDSATWLG
jgi:hypothetical protein